MAKRQAVTKVRPTQSGTSDRFLMTLARVRVERPRVSEAVSLPFLEVLVIYKEMPKQAYTHVGQLKVVQYLCSPATVSETTRLFGELRTPGGWGAPCRPRPAALRHRLGAAAGRRGAHFATWRQRREAPARDTDSAAGGGSKGLSCQRRDVKQVSKAPHISAD